jgi:hypothetical protein
MCAVARYKDQEVANLFGVYRRLFPNTDSATWGQLAGYWDFSRSRAWSCLTTNFHAVTLAQICAFDAARREWCKNGDPQQDGQALDKLARTHRCGFSLGINPWTDRLLHQTITKATRKLIVLVAHDWYPIVISHKKTNVSEVWALPPLDPYLLLDAPDSQWRMYTDGMPKGEDFCRHEVGLLFLNLVPDFRPPAAAAHGRFPFPDATTFDYPKCVDGLVAALESAQDAIPIRDVVTWGGHAWRHLSRSGRCPAAGRGLMAAASSAGEGFTWQPREHTWQLHPFPHPCFQSNWKKELKDTYRKMWARLLI